MSELSFRAVRPADCAAIASWVDTPALLVQWSGPADFSWPLSVSALEADVARVDPERSLVAVVDAASDEILGQASLRRQAGRDTAQIGRVIVDPAARGRGVAGALMDELVRIGFAQWNVHRLQLYVYDFNAPAIAVYQRAGFMIEGTLRDAGRAPGAEPYWNLHVMGQLQSDHRAGTSGGAARPGGA